jgi:hypothetical protein
LVVQIRNGSLDLSHGTKKIKIDILISQKDQKRAQEDQGLHVLYRILSEARDMNKNSEPPENAVKRGWISQRSSD